MTCKLGTLTVEPDEGKFRVNICSWEHGWITLYTGDRKDCDHVAKLAGYARDLGLAFHPDTRAEDYETRDPATGEARPYFSEWGAQEYEAIMSTGPCDPYEIGLKVWEALGHL